VGTAGFRLVVEFWVVLRESARILRRLSPVPLVTGSFGLGGLVFIFPMVLQSKRFSFSRVLTFFEWDDLYKVVACFASGEVGIKEKMCSRL